jgi:hypothetical protein
MSARFHRTGRLCQRVPEALAGCAPFAARQLHQAIVHQASQFSIGLPMRSPA